jgi:hypothetical protein
VKNGSFDGWRLVKTQLENRMYHSIAFHRELGLLYVAGGLVGDGLSIDDHTGTDRISAIRIRDLGVDD